MNIGGVSFAVQRGKSPKLVILGRPFGQEVLITLQELESLAAYLTSAAEHWRADDDTAKRGEAVTRDYYAILGISRDATKKMIKDAYRKLARQFHPDHHPGDTTAEEKFKLINEAYTVLTGVKGG